MLGQALGDALGFVVEAEPPLVAREYVEDWLRRGRAGDRSSPHLPFGQYTDDTQLARELLCSFREARGWSPAVYADRLARLFGEKRDVGAGPGTRGAAQRLLEGIHWSASGTPPPYAGNGSAMRAGPLGLLITDRRALTQAAREQSRITHLDPRCGAGSVAVSLAVAIASRDRRVVPAEFVDEVASAIEQDDGSFSHAVRELSSWMSLEPAAAATRLQESRLDPAHPIWQGISAFVVPSVLWSLYAFLRSPDDYWETVCTAIAVGGDTDTMASMAGVISGARAGAGALPEKLVARVNDRGEWGADALVELARDCAALVEEDR
jgi:ADP-ribosylglycohydrolase